MRPPLHELILRAADEDQNRASKMCSVMRRKGDFTLRARYSAVCRCGAEDSVAAGWLNFTMNDKACR
jgi:hypothetical protein